MSAQAPPTAPRTPRAPSFVAASVVAPLVALLIALVPACGGAEPPSPAPAPTSTTPAAAPPLLPGGIDVTAPQADVRIAMLARELVSRGYQCGWHGGWMRTVKDARHDTPAAFRGRAAGAALTSAFVAFVIGVTATFFLAWLLPRLARRRKAPLDAPPAATDAARPPGWSAYFKEMGVRALQRLGRLLHVELFDPLLASQRTQAIHTTRDAERQLAVAIDAVAQLAPPPADASAPATGPAADVRQVLASWRGELASLRKKLEAPGALPRELALDTLTPRLDNILRMSRDVRVGLERALVATATAGRAGLDEGAWHVWLQRLAERPKTPHEQAPAAHALPTWVKPLGWGGLAGVALAMPLMGLWMAAGAFPLFFAFLVAAGGLGAVVVARVYLHRAGRQGLLPGFADRVARWLVSATALAFVLMLVSSWMSSESGLDLGDPPPVPVPDPAQLEAPSLWTDTK